MKIQEDEDLQYYRTPNPRHTKIIKKGTLCYVPTWKEQVPKDVYIWVYANKTLH